MASKTRYYDRDGAPIEKDRWLELSKDPVYSTMRSYETETMKAEIIWLGKVVSPENMDADYWPLYRIDVFNKVDGQWRPDPAESGDTYGRLPEAVSDYETFLAGWTEATIEDDGKGRMVFVEGDDNLAALPDEPDRDTPESASVIGTDGVEGAW